ncbi:MAG: efflux RND transporter periplasmic adaptor subunit [Chlamydiales bacterium]
MNKLFTPLFILIVLFLNACTQQQTEEQNIRPVKTFIVTAQQEKRKNVYSGYAKAAKTIKLSFRIDGNINQLPFKVGQKLQPGDLLAKLDPTDYILQIHSAEAELEKGMAELKNTQAKYRRYKTLYESDSISRNELDAARAAYESARAAVKKAEKHISLAEQKLSYTTLTVEDEDCFVSKIYAEENENIKAGQHIAELICGRELEVEIGVPESEIHQMGLGRLGTIRFNILPDKTFKGIVSEVSIAPNVGTTFPIILTLENHDSQVSILPGMAAKVFFSPPNSKEPVFMLPIEAVHEDEHGHYVYVYEPIQSGNGVAKKRTISIGEVSPDGIEVIAGLSEGQRVITAGTRFLEEGKVVRLIKE